MKHRVRAATPNVGRMVSAALVVTLVASVAMLGGCTPSTSDSAAADSRPVELSVSAATTLKTAFTDIAPAFEEANHVKLVYNFGASGVLQKQIEGGAPCDVFASASPKQIDALVAAGLVSADSTSTFASNELVIVVPPDNPATIAAPGDLAKADKIVTGNPETAPHGSKAKEFLTGLGQWDALAPKLVFAENAAQTVDYVSRGEVQAGLVFASEVLGNDSVKIAYTVPADAIKPVRYVAAPIKDSSASELAEKFVAYLADPNVQQALIENGFKPASGH